MSDDFAEEINRLLREGYERLLTQPDPAPDGREQNPFAILHAEKAAAYLPVSFEHLIDAGAMTEEEARARGWEPTVYPPIPRRVRLRWWINARRIRFGRWLGSWIAGERLYTDDEAADYE